MIVLENAINIGLLMDLYLYKLYHKILVQSYINIIQTQHYILPTYVMII